MRLERLTRGHVLAAVAALALLLTMAMVWYGSKEADLAHQAEANALTTGGEGGEVHPVDPSGVWVRTEDRGFCPLLRGAIASAGCLAFR